MTTTWIGGTKKKKHHHGLIHGPWDGERGTAGAGRTERIPGRDAMGNADTVSSVRCGQRWRDTEEPEKTVALLHQ